MSTMTASRPKPATLAEVIVEVASRTDLPDARRRDMASACRTIARLLGMPPSAIAADAGMLRARLKLMPATPSGLSPGGWRNTKSRLNQALAITGVASMGRRSNQTLSSDWAALLKRIPERYWRSNLSRLARHCSHRGVLPEQVSDTVVDAFGAMLRDSMVERPKQVHRDTCLAWNRAVGAIPGWPPVTLAVPSNRRDISLPLSDFPASFSADVEAFLARMAGDDLFDDTGRQPASPATLKSRRLQLRQLASVLMLSGRDITTITGLADLVAIDAAKQALRFFHVRNGGRKTGQLHNLALLLVQLGKYWVKAPPSHVEALQALRRQVDPKESGMTARNRARLRAFDDEENVRRLLGLPEAIMRSLGRRNHASYGDAIRVQSALAIAIALVAPLRAKNLAGLRIDRHFHRTRLGPDGVTHLVIPAGEVKNQSPLEFELPPDVVRLLDLYLRMYRPVLNAEASAFLFPARDGSAKTPARLGEQIKRTIRQEIGLDVNPHLFRHLAAKLFLQQFPGEYETVRLLLGHKNLVTTVRTYCDLRQTDAARRYDAMLQGYRVKDAAD